MALDSVVAWFPTGIGPTFKALAVLQAHECASQTATVELDGGRCQIGACHRSRSRS